MCAGYFLVLLTIVNVALPSIGAASHRAGFMAGLHGAALVTVGLRLAAVAATIAFVPRLE
jgi:hypothetical protein